MTKRILALVLALTLALTMLSVQAFAIDNWTITPEVTDVANSTNKTVSFAWNAPTGGADYYTVTIANGTTNVVNNVRVTATTYSYTATTSGDYNIIVRAYKNTSSIEIAIYQGVAKVFIAQSSNGTGGLKVSSLSNSQVSVEWTAQPGNPTYYVSYTLTNGNTGGKESSTNYTTLDFGYSDLRSISVYQGTSASHGTSAIATWSNTGSNNPGVDGGYGVGGVLLSNGVLRWNSTGAVGYYVTFAVGNSSTYTPINNNGGFVYTNYADVSSILNAYRNSNITFVVKSYSGESIGAYYYTPSNNNTGNYNLYVVPSYTGTASATWSAYPGADNYYVTATVNGTNTYSKTVYTTSDPSIKYTYGQVTIITIQAAQGGRLLGTIASATINANGQVSYTGANGGNWGGSWGNWGGSSNGLTVTGANCILTVGSTSSYLQWNTTIAGPYTVLVMPVGQQAMIYNVGTVSSLNIPLGQNVGFQVIVYTTNTRTTVASATYTATSSRPGSTTTTKSSIKDLTVTATSNNSTTISWAAVSGATSYELEYAPIGSIYYNTDTTRNTSFALPYGKNTGFEAYVYAYVGGVKRFVGSIVHVAGDDFPTEDKKTDDTPKAPESKPDTTPAYVTGFKGTVGTSGTITLAWNAASGKPTYEIYYKKTSASAWKKLYSTTARSLKVNKLTDGTSYDFKVVANGKDSGILTMTIGTTSSTKTAADPGSSTTTTAAPELTSASGGSGSITASWTTVKGANLYRVYIAEDGETTYKTKTTAWSTSKTSLTLTGVKAGTYKVRIKASTDNGKTWTDLADCDYMVVTVK